LRAQLEAATSRESRCGIFSFGIAGGLDPTLAAGDWVVAASVVSVSGRFPADQAWATALMAAIPGAMHADIAGADMPVADPVEKLALHRLRGAVAVDTESHVAAAVAAERGLPFAAARVVLDPARRRLPPAALVPLRPDGSADIAGVLRSVWHAPSQLPRLLTITAEAALAWGALARGRRCLGDRLALPGVTPQKDADTAAVEPEWLAQSVVPG
jgi:hypothetical protein